MQFFTNSVERAHALSALLSTGYTDCASAFFPLGRLIFAASQIKAFEAAHATSRAFLHTKCQVLFPFFDDAVFNSSLPFIVTVLSLAFALLRRLNCSVVKTSAAFCKSPEPATTAQVPKRITNAQTVCNEKNAKGKLCNGHLKQLRTAGEASEIHLRGDDVLSKCQTCGTLYMGPPLGHVRDPNKQSRFVEAELTALLQAAGGTLPVIKKDERGVYVMVEAAAGHAPAAAKAAPAKAAAPAAQPKTQAAAPKAAAAKPAATKTAGADPNRQLFKRSTYAGVKDTGPVPSESFADKVARLKAVSVAAKQRAEEAGDETAPVAQSAPAEPDIEAPTPQHR